jgi:alanyl-tRNA synthetase
MTSANDIRTGFIDFFGAHRHEEVASGLLVPHNDPTLLFTNAGMVQFKNVFTGAETRPYDRAVTSQKCVRAGGKHNDLDNVGYTARHHTFFEMLGNFSFGDYFKDVAIDLAWTLLTRDFGIAPERLVVTVFHDDDDAARLWRKISGLPEERILRIATSDNFWSMGDTGPCGPCSEIFYDHGEAVAGGPPGSADEDGDRFIEIWNLVFMQYEKVAAGERRDLPKPSVDTGMGLERMTAVMQGTYDNYAIDLLRNLILASAEKSSVPADGDHAVSHRVIADHLRAAGFLLADGVMPSNEGRGYVLRRIMRRGMRHAHLMGCQEPLLWQLVPALVGEMGQAFPELVRAQALMTETLKLEETRFKRTLERGLRLLDDEVAALGPSAELPGAVAFKLYDTYGFPLDLTEDALRTQGRGVDHVGFDKAMARQKAEARAAWAGSGDAGTEDVWYAIRERAGTTEFLGYATETAEARVEAIVANGAEVEEASAGQVQVVVNQTPFYGESGGQIGDVGGANSAGGAEIAFDATQKKLGDLYVHCGAVTRGTLRVGDIVKLRVQGAYRTAVRANHSATHLLHAALRAVLGEHVTQKGSLVAAERLRFDVSHSKPITADELRTVEALVNEQVRVNAAVATVLMAPDQAVEKGALALFGEKYGDEVRVVSMGGGAGAPYSVELCGGTHVGRTGDIGLFKIVSEGAVASGVRRIEALTGAAALEYVNTLELGLRETAKALKSAPAEAAGRAAVLIGERKRLEKELAEARRSMAVGGPAEKGADVQDIGGIRFSGRRLDGIPAKELRGMADEAKRSLGSGVVAIASVTDGKAAIVVGVSDDLTGRCNAVDLVRVAATVVGGKGGGGRPDMAQAGGPEGAKADAAIAAIAQSLGGG